MKNAYDIRNLLRILFSTLKKCDKFIDYQVVTGVSSFGKAAIYSGANNWKDISLNSGFNEIAGFTEAEIREYFKDYLKDLASSREENIDDLMNEIRD